MTANICVTCRKPKANHTCGLCSEPSCKSCAQFLGSDDFVFLKKVPEELTHSCYCLSCFNEKVSAPLAEYNETYEKAKDIIIYSKEQSKLTRFIKRKEDPILVDNCEDEQEALMRMSFEAVQKNHNCLIDIQFKTKKIIVGSHKKTIYSASAVPVTIDPDSIRGHMDPP